jgi:hypothetical protein
MGAGVGIHTTPSVPSGALTLPPDDDVDVVDPAPTYTSPPAPELVTPTRSDTPPALPCDAPPDASTTDPLVPLVAHAGEQHDFPTLRVLFDASLRPASGLRPERDDVTHDTLLRDGPRARSTIPKNAHYG